MTEIVVRGTLSDARHIELTEPVTGLSGEIEVTIRQVRRGKAKPNIFDLIADLPAGRRSKTEIDAQMREQKREWADR